MLVAFTAESSLVPTKPTHSHTNLVVLPYNQTKTKTTWVTVAVAFADRDMGRDADHLAVSPDRNRDGAVQGAYGVVELSR